VRRLPPQELATLALEPPSPEFAAKPRQRRFAPAKLATQRLEAHRRRCQAQAAPATIFLTYSERESHVEQHTKSN